MSTAVLLAAFRGRRKAVTATALAVACGLHRSEVSRALDDLERCHLVARTPGNSHGWYRLTTAGLAAASAAPREETA
jgi:DNA-binding IclR family transcriptional regulator